ncbi:AraC family transcriptional regulator [Riemerella anatipestifer]|uniref:AraC family transcriptional regulator n=1 Tax=Riemerella anatipestifer TaxID=34085 RepID=UPI002364397B|nr:helix-turn-helix domain-containing protein [Riemerella anatipestifer]MDD1539111.1 helix-turn-helix domain-containing protein [Riemerella anatipestifer]
MKFYIKNMVCSRCKMMVEAELKKLNLTPVSVELGEVEITENTVQKDKLITALQSLSFDLIDDKRSKIIENIKRLIIDLVQNKNSELKTNLSTYLSQNLSQDYSILSHLFSEVESTTIEKYFISQKIEKVKELLIYDEMTLSEIAFQLNYSSVAHLSNQFKKHTGFSPSYFKKLKDKKRQQIEDL